LPVRPASEKDIPAISRIYVETWFSTYRRLMADSFLKAVNPVSAERTFWESFLSKGYSYFVLVAENSAGEIMGYLDGGRDREDPKKHLGEIYGLYVLENFQGKGTGRELLRRAFEEFRTLKFPTVRAWVLKEGPSRGFYEREDGKLQNETKQLALGTDSINLVSYRWNL
jgi:ribosomal protein S18 acetylase RimI-like enzyme